MAVTPIVIENGSVVTGANSYATEDELIQFAEDQGYAWAGGDYIPFLYRAMDWIESQQYQGEIVQADQPLMWPRKNVYYRGFKLGQDAIPELVKKAQLTLAMEINRGFDPLAVISQGVKREKVDVIEVEYQDGTSTFAIRSVNAILRPLLAGGANSAMRVL
jgi:hypothetical protein